MVNSNHTAVLQSCSTQSFIHSSVWQKSSQRCISTDQAAKQSNAVTLPDRQSRSFDHASTKHHTATDLKHRRVSRHEPKSRATNDAQFEHELPRDKSCGRVHLIMTHSVAALVCQDSRSSQARAKLLRHPTCRCAPSSDGLQRTSISIDRAAKHRQSCWVADQAVEFTWCVANGHYAA